MKSITSPMYMVLYAFTAIFCCTAFAVEAQSTTKIAATEVSPTARVSGYNPSFLERNVGSLADVMSTYAAVRKGFPETNGIYKQICNYQKRLGNLPVGSPGYDSEAAKFAGCVAVLKIGLSESARFAIGRTAKDSEAALKFYDRTVNALGFGASCHNYSIARAQERDPSQPDEEKAVMAGMACGAAYLLATSKQVKKALGIKPRKKNKRFTTKVYFEF